MWEIKDIVLMVYLMIGAIWDLLRRRVPVWYLAVGTALVIGYQIFSGGDSIVLTIFGGITGGIFLLLSKYTNQGIGYGDSWMICILGIYLGIWKLLVVLAVAFLSVSVIAMMGMFRKKFQRDTRLPFFPFLVIGFLGIYGW